MRLIKYIALFSILISGLNASYAAGDAAKGEALFLGQCASCHNRNMKDDLTGPALGGVQGRWENEADLYAWIRNSQAMVAKGHPRSVELWNKWNRNVMSSFTGLTDDEIANLLAYIDGVYVGTYGPNNKGDRKDDVAVAPVAEKGANLPLFILLFVILALLAVVLARIIANLNYVAELKAGNTAVERSTLIDILTSKGVIGFMIFALVVLGGYTTVNNAIELGRQQGYQPEQPIKFSHATHSGLHKVDCQYCHDGARRSKQSVIPATNTCMNCHRAIKVGSEYGTAELTKIYASIGYDPIADKYIENYDQMSEEDIKKIYTKWIGDTYVKANPDKASKAQDVIDEQWKGIKTSLTNEDKPKIQGPIEWLRIHNLPDHAYFNHAQHVAVGKVECQTCHGPVQEMKEVYQHTPLSMGWCVNCHRQTEVAAFKDNEYYQSYQNYHQEIKDGKRNKVTVEDIGGLGCQKCHY
jgi:cytochrome c2